MKAESKKNTPSEVQEEGNIDKIRDILFGSQARDFDRRFSKFEERMVSDMSDMRDENRKRIESLEEFIKNELKSLAERLTAEQNARADANKELSGELKELSHNFDRKITQINEQSAKHESDLRQQILNQSKNLTEEIQKRHTEALSKLDRESSEIREDKADRIAIANIFTEMAMRLTGDFKLPTEE